MNLNQLTLTQVRKGLNQKKFSSYELTKDCLNQIKKVEPKINAFITVCEKQALEKAKQADEQFSNETIEQFSNRPLLGIPIAIKDNFCTQEIKTTAASKLLKDFIPPYDATVVKKLKDSGAIILGKTNMDAWAHGSSTETSDFGVTKNPWDINKLPGGSSGGSAAAVASDEIIAAVGSETAGSIRQPASWCGIVGLKPTYGRISRYGVIAMASSLDCPGPMTKTIEDSALMLQVLAGKDNLDATTSPLSISNYSKNLKKSIKGLRIGYSEQYIKMVVDPDVRKKIKNAINKFEKLGAIIKEIDLFNPKYAIAVYTILQRSEVSSNLARYDGIRYGKDRANFGEEAKRRIMLGTYTLSSGYYDQYYNKAQKVRTLIIKDFERAFKEVDVIIGPTTTSVALSIGAINSSSMFGELSDLLIEPSSIAGLPGINLRCEMDLTEKRTLPICFQIIGPQFAESLILNAAYQFEQLTQDESWSKQKPNL